MYLLGNQIHLYSRMLKLYWASFSYVVMNLISRNVVALNYLLWKLFIWLVIILQLTSKVHIRWAVPICCKLVTLAFGWLRWFFKQINGSIILFCFQAGNPWFSILTRTGVFRGESNHAEFPADLASQLMKWWFFFNMHEKCIIWNYTRRQACAHIYMHFFSKLSTEGWENLIWKIFC